MPDLNFYFYFNMDPMIIKQFWETYSDIFQNSGAYNEDILAYDDSNTEENIETKKCNLCGEVLVSNKELNKH